MSSRVVARVLFASLGFVMLAGMARAQAGECVLPEAVPEAVYTTILNQSNLSFGALAQKACDGIVKSGVAMCKSQTKANTKCYLRALAGNFAIQIRQCAEIVDPVMRKDCYDTHKADRDSGKQAILGSMGTGLMVCDQEFVSALGSACMLGAP